MKNLKSMLASTEETLTIIVDERHELMSITTGEVSTDTEAGTWVGCSKEDIEILKEHASKVYRLGLEYYYVIYSRKKH